MRIVLRVFVPLIISLFVPVSSESKQGAAAAAGSASPASVQSSTASATQPSQPQQANASTASFEDQKLAYDALTNVATQIGTKVCNSLKTETNPNNVPESTTDEPTTNLVIYDQASFSNMLAFEGFVQNAWAISSSYNSIEFAASTKADTPTFTAGGGTGGTSTSFSYSPVSDLTGILSTVAVSANSETYGSVVIPDSALALALADHLKCKLNVVYPPLFGRASVGNSPDILRQNINTLMLTVETARANAHTAVAKTLAKDKAIDPAKFPASDFTAMLKDTDALYDTWLNALLSQNTPTGALGSVQVLQGYALAALLDGDSDGPRSLVPVADNNGDDGQKVAPKNGGTKQNDASAYVLIATVLAAGGTNHDHKSFWTNLGHGDKITYSGGVVVGAALWRNSGGLKFSTVFSKREPFTSDPSN